MWDFPPLMTTWMRVWILWNLIYNWWWNEGNFISINQPLWILVWHSQPKPWRPWPSKIHGTFGGSFKQASLNGPSVFKPPKHIQSQKPSFFWAKLGCYVWESSASVSMTLSLVISGFVIHCPHLMSSSPHEKWRDSMGIPDPPFSDKPITIPMFGALCPTVPIRIEHRRRKVTNPRSPLIDPQILPIRRFP